MVWSRGSRINDPLLALHPQIYHWSDGHWVALWGKVGARFWQGGRVCWIIKGQYLQVRFSCTVPIVKNGNAELAILSSNLVRAMDFMKAVDDYAWAAGINGHFKVSQTTLSLCLWLFNELWDCLSYMLVSLIVHWVSRRDWIENTLPHHACINWVCGILQYIIIQTLLVWGGHLCRLLLVWELTLCRVC